MNMRLKMASHARPFVGLATMLAVVFLLVELAGAGGPKYIAGTSYFSPSTMGQPIIWSSGNLNYYTDQGDLSPILPSSAANALVASAFSQWTSVPTAAFTATNAGQLDEDVTGSNIAVDSSGDVTAPSDITPAATQKSVGIVYDYDGSVTDALLGAGAGNPSECFWNAVYGGTDNFGVGAIFVHALVIINGQCALQTPQLTDVEYRLVRVLGSVIGLDWSQMNLNVITGNPTPTPDDFAGFPVMHFTDLPSCVPITACYPNPFQLAADDVAALSRLYPAATSSTARIHGSVHFVDHNGGLGQPMQGVNVFARWIDPATGQPSHCYAASSVSGFRFTGNAGNPITGWNDPRGKPYSEFGSSDQSLAGFFDLGGLPIPNGASSAQYQLVAEALDPLWSAGISPYESSQVAPSGTMKPIVVTVNAGGDFQQDIVMAGSAQAVPAWSATATWDAPAAVPTPGDWIGSLDAHGEISYFQIAAQANRTLSVTVTALDDAGASTESKAAPVIGIWTLGDPAGSPPPALTTAAFNSETFGMSRLDAQIIGSNGFIIGISDLRGDGRPDYHYHAHVLYGDSAIPPRISVNGGTVTLQGTGFKPDLGVSVGSLSVPLLATNNSQMLTVVPAQSDGVQTITVSDPASGAFSTMTNALTIGAAATDKILLLPKLVIPASPVGIPAANPMIVQVVESDGITPVNGATVAWSTTNKAVLSACGGTPTCSVVSDESGFASTWVTPGAPGAATITATLAPAAYNPAQSVSTTVVSSTLGIGVAPAHLSIASEASLSVPITASVVSQGGAPQAGVTVDFFVAQGVGSLSAPSAVTDSSGNAEVTLTLTNFTANVEVNACVAPANNPCQNLNGSAVPPTMWNLQPVAGSGQIVAGSAFQPLTVRVTDSSTPPNPVLAADVLFQSTVLRPVGNDLALQSGDNAGTKTGMPVILSSTQVSVQSDANGLASFVPSVGVFTGLLEVEIQVAAAGTTANLRSVLESFPPSSGGPASLHAAGR